MANVLFCIVNKMLQPHRPFFGEFDIIFVFNLFNVYLFGGQWPFTLGGTSPGFFKTVIKCFSSVLSTLQLNNMICMLQQCEGVAQVTGVKLGSQLT